MQNEIQKHDLSQICDLEYDVAGVGSAESVSSEINLAAFVFLFSAPSPTF